MFEEMKIGEILKDLRSVKVPPDTRKFIDKSRDYFESEGSLPIEDQKRLRRLCSRYRVQLKELYAARSRARKTNGLRQMGITQAEAKRRAEMRREAVEKRNNDVGF